MTDPRSVHAKARLRTHLWVTPLIAVPLGWVFRRTTLGLAFVVVVGLAYYLGLGALYLWSLRQPDRALGPGADAPASRLERFFGLATTLLGLATVVVAFWGIDEWDLSTQERAAGLAAEFRIRMVAGLAVAIALSILIWFRARHRPRRLEFFGQAAVGLLLAVVGLSSIILSEKVVAMFGRHDGPPPRLVGLGGWRTSPPKIAMATEVVSEDGSQVLLAIRAPMERGRACEPMKDLEPGKINREARVEQLRALPDLSGIECRSSALLVAAGGQEEIEVGLRRCSEAEGYMFAYRWVGERLVRPEDLPGHLGCAP